MTNLNMPKVSTLFRKGYLLAGVIMAANMFVVNEMKASENDNSIKGTTEKKDSNIDSLKNIYMLNQGMPGNIVQTGEEGGKENDQKKQSPLDILLSLENYFNLFGTLALSGINNYLKWWDYNAGGYCTLRIGCLGYRTKKFFDIVQLDFNLNLWRGIGWLIPHIIKFRQSLTKAEIKDTTENKPNEEGLEIKSVSNVSPWVSFLFKGILRGFVSAPLTFHISNFSIAISLDSILWEFVIGRFFDEDKEEKPPVTKIEIEKKEIGYQPAE